MTVLQELPDDQLHLPSLFDEPPAPAVRLVTVDEVVEDVEVIEVVEVVEVRSPLTVITWSAAAVGVGLGTIAVMLLLGPILGTVALVAAIVAILRRYERASDEPAVVDTGLSGRAGASGPWPR